MNNLDKSVDLIRDSVLTLDSTVKNLQETTKYSRNLQKILQTSRVFDLVAEADLINAKQSFKKSINPEIELIVNQIESKVSKLRKQKVSLDNKFKLNEVRLSSTSSNVVLDNPKQAQLKQLRIRKLRLQQSLANAQKRSSFIPNLSHPDN